MALVGGTATLLVWLGVGPASRRPSSSPSPWSSAFGLVLRPEIAAISMSGSSLIVAVNALLLRRLRLPGGR